jgi:cell division protein FtsI/penicillin-binding protein 2
MKNMLFLSFAICIALIIRIGFIQFVQGSELKDMAYMQQTLNRNINPKRGTIYDSTGKNILAISASVETVSINPRQYSRL